MGISVQQGISWNVQKQATAKITWIKVLNMDKSQIQERTKKLLEKAEKPEEFTEGLQELLKSYVDRVATKNYQRIIPDTGKFFGVPLPILRIIAAEIGKYIQKEPTKAKVLLETIWNEGSFEARQIAGKCLEKFGPKNLKICLCGVEPIVYHNPELVLPLSEKWIKDKNKWIRRFGVVSLREYKRIQITDKVFEILDLVMEDKDKDVKKAVSWILREITKKNPDEAAEFLMKWAKANPSKDAKWVIKDGMKKLGYNEQKKILGLLD
jgi:3-methyladenine DNA glycosylase AlkC